MHSRTFKSVRIFLEMPADSLYREKHPLADKLLGILFFTKYAPEYFILIFILNLKKIVAFYFKN